MRGEGCQSCLRLEGEWEWEGRWGRRTPGPPVGLLLGRCLVWTKGEDGNDPPFFCAHSGSGVVASRPQLHEVSAISVSFLILEMMSWAPGELAQVTQGHRASQVRS